MHRFFAVSFVTFSFLSTYSFAQKSNYADLFKARYLKSVVCHAMLATKNQVPGNKTNKSLEETIDHLLKFKRVAKIPVSNGKKNFRNLVVDSRSYTQRDVKKLSEQLEGIRHQYAYDRGNSDLLMQGFVLEGIESIASFLNALEAQFDSRALINRAGARIDDIFCLATGCLNAIFVTFPGGVIGISLLGLDSALPLDSRILPAGILFFSMAANAIQTLQHGVNFRTEDPQHRKRIQIFSNLLNTENSTFWAYSSMKYRLDPSLFYKAQKLESLNFDSVVCSSLKNEYRSFGYSIFERLANMSGNPIEKNNQHIYIDWFGYKRADGTPVFGFLLRSSQHEFRFPKPHQKNKLLEKLKQLNLKPAPELG